MPVIILVKIIITAILIVAITEISKRSTFVAGLLASVPITSVFALIWLYIDTKDVTQINALSISILWLVIPSLALFISLPILLRTGIHFYFALFISAFITIMCYMLLIIILKYLDIRL